MLRFNLEEAIQEGRIYCPSTRMEGIKVITNINQIISPFHVFIDLPILQKIKCFINLCDFEINGLGNVESQDNDFFIREVFILKQYTDPNLMTVDIDDKALNLLIVDLVNKGMDASGLKFQWHSHVYGRVFFSEEYDIDTIKGYMCDFMISLVMNKLGDYKCRLDIFKPFVLSLEIPLLVILPRDKTLIDFCRKEISKKVISKSLFAKNVSSLNNPARDIVVDAKDIKLEGGDQD